MAVVTCFVADSTKLPRIRTELSVKRNDFVNSFPLLTHVHMYVVKRMAGFLTFTLSVCLCKISKKKNIEPINFIFGGGLPSDPKRKPFYLGKNRAGVRVIGWWCGGGGVFEIGPKDKR